MYRDSRPAPPGATTASTQEYWARNFAASTGINAWRGWRMRRTRQWQLIDRHVPAGARLLDAGCGTGEWVTLLAKHGYQAEGLDYSVDLIRRLREAYPSQAWQHGAIQQIPHADASFDAVISWGVIEHDEDGPGGALREFRRILRPGGVGLVTVPIDSRRRRRSAEYLSRHWTGERAFFQYFMTPDELAAHVTAAGFEVLESGVLPHATLRTVAPMLEERLRGLAFRAATFAVNVAWSRMLRYATMQYCVCRKPGGASAGSGPAER